ncbi:DegT/DnrJ/EryC1/StrS family aminotransferase [Luteolibacter flavescens]|uniref:DegT/DnrJ/EryC1/StrS family aminotransferase n=1 Tax=Luteolibacter flavescens TaxID=1859460 RepID=A0ABT3FPD5_9BACT|nr:DegT/DnrJ/EryC1/StrS family aminotransferase [Luteolibacter flavescens]MCW1885194.1 DegT/DnrJ/EryC1/StrS family aminotransferase [Luteolibacter flavescens]
MSVPLLDVNAQNLPLEAELKQVFENVLRSGRFILGEEVEAFEKECAAALGAKHAISISSGTDALIVALMALDIGPGDEVLCPSFTFFATAGSVFRTGATPVFCDVEPEFFGIDLASAKSKLTPKTKAIIPVHLYGQAVDMDAMTSFAKEHGLKVVEDVAQSFGATYRGRACGTIGDIGSYSFFPSKNLGGFGDGGLVTTECSELHEKMLRLRNHGMHPRYHHSMVGGNFRMDALQCALLQVKLRHIGEYSAGRTRNANYYTHRLSPIAGDSFILPAAHEHARHVWNQYTIRVPGRRDELKTHLTAKGIGCEIYYPVPMHRQECFEKLPEHSLSNCPVSDLLAAEVISIPVYAELVDAQLDEVAAALESFLS